MPNIGPQIEDQIATYGNAESLKAIFQKHGPRIAAFMIETVQGSAGSIVPPAGYLQAVRDLCTEYNVLWIADEVQCGLGRTGYMAAYQVENVKPNMVVLGKGLVGGAYSMGLVMGYEETMRCYKYGQSVYLQSPVYEIVWADIEYSQKAWLNICRKPGSCGCGHGRCRCFAR